MIRNFTTRAACARTFALGASLVVLAGCATTESVPYARTLSPEMAAELADTTVAVRENDGGIRAAWTSAAYGNAVGGVMSNPYIMPAGVSPLAAGIGGGIGQAIAIAILDAAPGARADRSTRSINAGIDPEALDRELAERFKDAAPAGSVRVEGVEMLDADMVLDDAIIVDTRYLLAEDASAVQVAALVSYEDERRPYQTRYTFAEKTPKAETRGPHYRNSFTYHSDRFEAPAMTDAVREELVAAAKAQYADGMADLDNRFTEMSEEKAARKRQKEAEKLAKTRDKVLGSADDDKLSKTERAVITIDKWKDGALESAIDEAHAFIVASVMADLNRSDIPQFERQAELTKEQRGSFFKAPDAGYGPIGNAEFEVIGEEADGRQILRITSGMNAGAIHSVPAEGFATYGNTSAAMRR